MVLYCVSQPVAELRGANGDGVVGRQLQPEYLLSVVPTSVVNSLVILATLATIIASQAVISGAFSMTRQAIQLNWLPRLQILQTTKESYGQIYIGSINFMLMSATLLLAIFSRPQKIWLQLTVLQYPSPWL